MTYRACILFIAGGWAFGQLFVVGPIFGTSAIEIFRSIFDVWWCALATLAMHYCFRDKASQ